MQVEFLDDEPPAGHRDLPQPAAHPARRAVIALLCLAVAALVAVVLVNRDHSASRRAVASSGAATGVPATGAVPSAAPAVADGVLGAALDLGGTDLDVLDGVASGAHLYLLLHSIRDDAVLVRALLLSTRQPSWSVTLGDVPFNALPFLHLVADPSGARLWIVSEGTEPAPVRVVATAGPARGPDVAVPATVYDTAVLAGHLYLATSAGVMDVVPGAQHAVALAGRTGLVTAIAADPARNRLLALDATSPVHVLAVTPGRGVRGAATLPSIGVSSIAVVAGSIWLGGYSDTGSVVVRLAPAALTPVQVSPVSALTGPGTRVVAGHADLFVTSGAAPAAQGWCVDGRDGSVLASWTGLAGPLSSAGGRVFALTDSGVRVAAPGDCRG
jgi:hypothetical protein